MWPPLTMMTAPMLMRMVTGMQTTSTLPQKEINVAVLGTGISQKEDYKLKKLKKKKLNQVSSVPDSKQWLPLLCHSH